MNEQPTSKSSQEDDEQNIFPFFKTWKQLYIFVLAELAILIVLFYIFSQTYAWVYSTGWYSAVP